MTTSSTHAPPSHRRLALILGALAALGPLSIDMYLPSFAAIAESLGTDIARVQLTLATYLAGLAVGQLAYGPLSDRFGRRKPLLGGLALYGIASLAAAAAPTVEALAAARFLQALGGCAGMVISRAVVRDYFGEKDSARLYSSLMLVMGVAPIVAPSLGGQVLALGGWRAIFLVLAGAALVEFVMVASVLKESLPEERRVARGVRGTLRAAVQVGRSGRFLGLSVSGGAIQAAMFAYITGSPYVFIELFGMPADRYALVFGANAFGLIAASQANRILVSRFGVERVLRGATAVALTAFAALFFATRAGAGLPVLVPCLFVGIASVGAVMPNATALAMVPYAQNAGIASALLGTLQSVCGALASVMVSALADGTARPMSTVMLVCGLVSFTLALATARGRAPHIVSHVRPRG